MKLWSLLGVSSVYPCPFFTSVNQSFQPTRPISLQQQARQRYTGTLRGQGKLPWITFNINSE
ncbi:hypothetical protein BDU57DRAFT_523019 [Ampelomyces quisqualis]|uniref:Uncharacterized protein n=1 Tax=Ampelomyces quisqualis TaxID=50730 RepID=A0A6A5QB86_AMPQU|nr:hypothetical protein BDU57DRAFT_523019 [Ampelomyces quisqualis]